MLLSRQEDWNVKVKVKSLNRVRLFATPWTVAYQDPLSMGFSGQGCWSGLPFPSPGDLPDPEIEAGSPTLQADALPSEPPGKPNLPLEKPICRSGATVRTGHGTTDWFQIGKEVRQDCILSPCLFNLYAEYIMRNAGLEEAQASRLLGEIPITSDMQMTPPLWQKVKTNSKAS